MTFLQFFTCLRADPDTPKGQHISKRQRNRIAHAIEILVVLFCVPAFFLAGERAAGAAFNWLFP